MKNTLFVANISYDANHEDLTDWFASRGVVRRVKIIKDRETDRSKGYGFVTMSSEEEAQDCIRELHDKEFMGRPLVVTQGREKGNR